MENRLLSQGGMPGFDQHSSKEKRLCHATVDTSNLANVFEKVIDPMLRSLHVEANKSPLVRMWQEGRNGGEGTSTMDGITYYISVQHSKHSNVQAQAEGATLLRGRSRDAQMSFSAKDLNGAFTISYKAKKASENRAGSLVDSLMNESEAMLGRAQIMSAFYANNDGTGVFALVNDASSTGKSTIDFDTVRCTDISHILDVGDSIMLSTSGERTAGTGFPCTVTAINSSTQLAISETTAGTQDNDLMHFSEAYDTVGAAENSQMGVDGLLITSGTLQTISLSGAYYLQTNIESTGEAITESRVLQYIQLASPRMKDSAAFITTMGNLWYAFVGVLRGTAYTQATDQTLDRQLQGGASGLQIRWFGGDTPVIFDPFCRTGNVNGVDMHQFGYKQLYPLHLVEDGQQLAHRITQKLEYEVVATQSGNFYVIDPKACFKLTGKTVS